MKSKNNEVSATNRSNVDLVPLAGYVEESPFKVKIIQKSSQTDDLYYHNGHSPTKVWER